jgi:CelD/BcsL family acetyltransferase involved in cellulose biosynthesis
MAQVLIRQPQLCGEILEPEALSALAPAWDGLCERAIEDNAYYTPRYARALIDNAESHSRVHFALVWRHNALVALLPFTRSPIETPILGTAARAWQTAYTFSCTPLIDRANAPDAADALVDLLGSVNEGEWIIPALNRHGDASLNIIDALEKINSPWRFMNSFRRATLKTGDSFEEHMETHVASKRRRELARNRRRLEAIGRVAHESYRSGDKLTRAVEAFLAIEARGWKGKRRTALACHPDTRKFALDAFTGGEMDSICRADMLTLNGAPIAVGLTVFAGITGFTVKCTYDETYRNYSPGLLLEVEVIRSFLTDRWATRLDAGTAGTHVIDDLWPGRIEVADLLFTLAKRNTHGRLETLALADHARRATRSKAKLVAALLRSD